MQRIRRGAERGHFNHGWLDTFHTFSFGEYYDPEYMGFRALRVINEDRVAPGQGFGMHPHQDMEIITYVLSGELMHRDSLGTGATIRAGELQAMSAGSGIRHSEVNPSSDKPVHLYQIWLVPDTRGTKPRYDQKSFTGAGSLDGWQLVASKTATTGTLEVNSDALIYLTCVDEGRSRAYDFKVGRFGWLQVVSGKVIANGATLQAGDALALSDEPKLAITSASDAEVMLFDLA